MIPDHIPYDWMALRMAYTMSVHEPIVVTVGIDGYGGVVESPFTVELALAWANRRAEEVLV